MTTRADIYNAIRNADKSGDSAAVRKLGEYLKTMPADPTVNPEDTPGSPENIALHQARLKKIDQEVADNKSGSEIGKALSAVGDIGLNMSKGALDTAASLGSQAVLTPLAGIAGAVTAPFAGNDTAAKVVQGIQGAAYQPKSDVGKAAAGNIAKPFTWFAGKADQAGDAVANATGSPFLGTVVNTGIQSIPVFLTDGARAPFASAAKAGVGAAERALGGTGAAEAAASEAAATQAAAAAKAQAYAGSTGLDWNSLSDGIKSQLTEIAKTSKGLDQLDPQSLARQAKFESLPKPVPATRGMLEREQGALRNENNAASTKAGQPIADIHAAANAALIDNLDILKGRVAGSGKTAAIATTPEEAGGAVQGAARGKAATSKANYDALYKIARETEPNARASVTPVTDLLTQNPEIQHLGWVQTWLNRAAKAAGGKEGESIPITDATPTELADLRSQASEIARTGGKEGLYAGKVVGAIDQAMDSVPASAKAWKAANDAYKAHKTEFSEQGAVADLVDNSSRTDRTTALSNTVKSVTSGAPEEIRQIKSTLLTGGDEATRTAGRQAWREVRASVIDDIKNRATKGVAPLQDGSPNLTPSGLKSAIDSYGPQKLDEIFGPGTTKQLYKILSVAQDAKTIPSSGGASVGSSTMQNALAFLEKGTTKVLDKIPVLGKLGAAAAQSAFDTVAERGAINKATTTPLSESLRKASKMSAGRAASAAKTTAISSFASGANRQ